MALTKRGKLEVSADTSRAVSGVGKYARSLDKAKAATEAANSATEKLGSGFGGLVDQLGRVGLAFVGAQGIIRSVAAVARGFDELAGRSFKLQAVMGNLPIGIGRARDATMGLVEDYELAVAASKAVRLGAVESEEQFAKLAEAATKLGLSIGEDASKAVSDLTTGLARASMPILDNLGIILKVGDAHEIYAERIGKTVSELTAQEKQQAFVTVGLERAEEAASKVQLQVDETTKSWKQFKTDMQNLADEVLPNLLESLSLVVEALKGTKQLFDDFFRSPEVQAALAMQTTTTRGAPRTFGQIHEDDAMAAQDAALAEMAAATNARLEASGVFRGRRGGRRRGRRRDPIEELLSGGGAALPDFALPRSFGADLVGSLDESGDIGSAAFEEAANERFEALVEASRDANAKLIDLEEARAKREKELHKERMARIDEERAKREKLFQDISDTSMLAANTARLAAEVGAQSDERRLKAFAAAAGVEAAIHAALEAARSIAAFASYRYGAGVQHAAAAVAFTTASIQAFRTAGGGGGGGGGAGGVAPRGARTGGGPVLGQGFQPSGGAQGNRADAAFPRSPGIPSQGDQEGIAGGAGALPGGGGGGRVVVVNFQKDSIKSLGRVDEDEIAMKASTAIRRVEASIGRR